MYLCDYCGRSFEKKKSMTNHRRHHYKGYTENFINLRKGHETSEETRRKIGKANSGEKNGMWKGDKVKYDALHAWVRRHKPKPKLCEICKQKKPFDLANKSGKYKRDLKDWEWICRKCHMKSDGRFKNLKQYKEND